MPIRMTAQEFIAKANSVHGTRYSYAHVEYINNATPVVVTCKVHGNFLQRPTDHLCGKGCRKCFVSKPRTVTTDQFIAKAIKIHGTRYGYEEVSYQSTQTLVTLFCHSCNALFRQKPVNHLSGAGCAACTKTGYNPSKKGWLYVFTTSELTKIGITNRDPKVRLKELNKSSGENFNQILGLMFEQGSRASDIERKILAFLRSNHKTPEKAYNGSTETFRGVDVPGLLTRIAEENGNSTDKESYN